jgi:hypothetical protein
MHSVYKCATAYITNKFNVFVKKITVKHNLLQIQIDVIYSTLGYSVSTLPSIYICNTLCLTAIFYKYIKLVDTQRNGPP